MKSVLLRCSLLLSLLFLSIIPLSAQYAIQFDGVNDYVNVPDANTLDLNMDYTLEAWVYPNSFVQLSGIISKNNTNGSAGYTLRLSSDPEYSGLDGNGVSTSNGILSAGQWYHIAMTVDTGKYVSIYVNGVFVAAGTAPFYTEANTDPLTFGVDYLTSGRYWNGAIDEVRMWDTTLSASTIATWKDSLIKSSHPNYSHLIGYWGFNEGSGTTTVDAKNGNTGTLMNGATWTTNTPPSLEVIPFEAVYAGNVTPLAFSCVTFGDYDNDNDLDFHFGGDNGSSSVMSKLYQNTAGIFSEVYPGTLQGGDQGDADWADFDNDGKLDLVTVGYEGHQRVAKIFRNTGSGFTEVYPGSLHPVGENASVAWGDFNNDGKPDIILTGDTIDTGDRITKIYKNTGSGFTEVYAGTIPPVRDGSAVWGDYDNDGKLDILLSGRSTSGDVTKVYKNTGNGFTEVFSGSMAGTGYGSAAWGDYDNDGKLDILVTGNLAPGLAKIYHNTGSGFTEVYAGSLTGVTFSSAVWGDYDNDGKLDILLTGRVSGSNYITKIYHNTGSGFTELPVSLTGAFSGDGVWGDADNDGDLDFIVSGLAYINNFNQNIVKYYRNNAKTPNTPPTAPTGLVAVSGDSVVTFHWNRSTDAQTPTMGLTYNLRIGSTPEGVDVMSPLSDTSTGYRRVVQMGNTDCDTFWAIKGLTLGQTYYWSVQAIDNGFEGSPFATEGSFIAGGVNPLSTIGDNGTVTRTPDSSYYHNGTQVVLTAIPDSGYHFVNWSGDLSGTENPDTITMTGITNITAVFARNTYSITLDTEDGNVTKSPDSLSYTEGTTVILYATPNYGFHFAGWSGDLTGTQNPDTIIMDGNKSITAMFNINIVSTDVERNWNLVSLPIRSSNALRISMFPTAISNAFAFVGGYVTKDTLQNGKGYWLKFNAPEEIQFIGGETLSYDTIQVVAGWNMIGALSNPILASSITSDPSGIISSGFFGYGNGYVQSDTLMPGKGYWVKINQIGQLILNSGSFTKKDIINQFADRKRLIK